jgi:hypothetical protein
MIFNTFDPNQDIVAGRVTRVASGYWPDGTTTFTQSLMVDDFWALTGSGTPSPSYGTSPYDIRRTMYYLNMFPGASEMNNNNPFFSIAYGNIGGNIGSGSFNTETSSILASPAKAIYTQYKNILLGTSELSGLFTMASGSTAVTATDIWVFDFSAYKMKDNIDAGLLQFSLSGSNGSFIFIDDSPYSTQNQSVYEIIRGTLSSPPSTPNYQGLGLFYPADGVVILNAVMIAQLIGIPSSGTGLAPNTGGPGNNSSWWYTPRTATTEFTYNHKTLAISMELSQNTMNIRKSEYVPARHYFVRVKNRDFNYSNNPTYVYDGTDGVHPKGTIRWPDFITDPRTYVTTIGLYDNSNELLAVAKLSRPAVKSFDTELLIKVRLDF